MNPQDYSPEMRKDIEERVAKAMKLLGDLQLQPQASVQAVNTGNDIFATKVICYLQDMKYTSPIKKSDL